MYNTFKKYFNKSFKNTFLAPLFLPPTQPNYTYLNPHKEKETTFNTHPVNKEKNWFP